MSSLPNLFGDPYVDVFMKGRFIAEGGFGSVYLCKSRNTHQVFAVKVENSKKKNSLFREWVALQQLGGTNGIPKVKWFGTTSTCTTLVMERLGQSVSAVRRQHTDFKLPLKMTLNIGIECVSILERIHSKGFLHCDIKPSNLVFGRGPSNKEKVYLIDFGCARKFDTGAKPTRKHIKKFVGTIMFASPNAQEGFSQSQRDDLISLGYTLVYLNSGKLPWSYYAAKPISPEDYMTVYQMKKICRMDSYFKNEPKCVKEFLQYCMKLFHGEVPNYSYLRNLLQVQLDISLKSE